jgi:hypothetical protein
MYWVMGGAILLGMGVLLRRLLGLGTTIPTRATACVDREHQLFCNAIAEEVESRSAILAVLINDAIGELASGNSGNAFDLLDLAESEWTRLADLLNTILRQVADYLPLAHVGLPVRSMVPGHFRSEVMIDYLRLHELVDQFLFHTKLRFHLQIRVLRHAVEILTTDFRRVEPKRHQSAAFSRAVWSRMDRDYHDFDLIAKRTVLAFGKLIGWLPERVAAGVVLALRPTLDGGVRSSVRERVRSAACQVDQVGSRPTRGAAGRL